ncbi:MAG TPA: hypothetical protein VII13_13060 [Vicinamibacteria bacterium]|jgi:hypothetical protein
MDQRGHTLLELLLVVAILFLTAAVGVPFIRAYGVEAALVGAGQVFKGEFRRARSVAVRTGAQTALRFERGADGADYVRLYADGNYNGVLSAEIRSGIDAPLGPARPLATGAARVRVGINPGVPAIPPEKGLLDASDPIRFGASNMLSFSPLGTATPGTFFLAGETLQAAVRVTAGTSRVRLLVCRGRHWEER